MWQDCSDCRHFENYTKWHKLDFLGGMKRLELDILHFHEKVDYRPHMGKNELNSSSIFLPYEIRLIG